MKYFVLVLISLMFLGISYVFNPGVPAWNLIFYLPIIAISFWIGSELDSPRRVKK